MTSEEFLQELLETQELSAEQENTLQAHKKEVTDFLRVEFGSDPKIKYAGSREKGTMIADQYDLDVVCYFPNTDTRSLKEIREDVSAHLKKSYIIQSKASAERITNLRGSTVPNSYHIDVVPGRFIENTDDVFLHVAYGDKERMQTNLKVHINHIVNSGCVSVIRLAKLWAYRNNIVIKTLILELFVVRALTGSRDKLNLMKSFRQVLEALRDEFDTLQLVDPANSNNILSQLVQPSEKIMVAQAAKETLDVIGESNELADWQVVFREEDDKGYYAPLISPIPSPSTRHPNTGFTPHSPHCAVIC